MGRRWADCALRGALAGALVAATTVAGAGAATAAGAATPHAGPSPTAGAAVGAPTPPPIPPVSAAVTYGQPATQLLASAVALSQVGHDDSALLAALGLTQSRLQRDDAAAAQARSAAQAAQAAADRARRAAAAASAQFASMQGALKSAVVFLYMEGPDPLPLDPRNGPLNLLAQDYAESTLSPFGVIASAHDLREARRADLRAAEAARRRASAALARALRAQQDQARQVATLDTELQAVSRSAQLAVATDHLALASEAAQYLTAGANPLQFTPKVPIPAPVGTTPVALQWAFAELGKPYVWGATGPDTFDCSGLTQFVWKAAGVQIPRVAADQDAWTIPVPLSEILPGDLVFFGTTDIHHVGIYIGDGLMINAPHTGDVIRVSSIWWSDLAGFGRVHAAGTPVPAHYMPLATAPARSALKAGLKPVPSQTAPPKGWKPKAGETTPVPVPGIPTAGPTTTTPPTSVAATATTLAQAPAPSSTTTTVPATSSTTNDTSTSTSTSTSSTTVTAPPGS